MVLIISIIALIFLYIFSVSLSKYENKFYWLFEVAHFLGGFFVAMFLFNFSLSFNSIILLVILTGVLWELGELIANKNKKIRSFLINKFNHHVAKVTIPDTILDLFLNFTGAIIFLYLFR